VSLIWSHIIISLRDFLSWWMFLFSGWWSLLNFILTKWGFARVFFSRGKGTYINVNIQKEKDIQLYFTSHGNLFIFVVLKLLEYSALNWTFILDFRLHDKLPTFTNIYRDQFTTANTHCIDVCIPFFHCRSRLTKQVFRDSGLIYISSTMRWKTKARVSCIDLSTVVIKQ